MFSFFPNQVFCEMSVYKCMNRCIKINPQIISLLKFNNNSFVLSAMQTSFCHKTICYFVLGFFLSHGDTHGNITITGEGLQNVTYTRHSWPLSSEVS